MVRHTRRFTNALEEIDYLEAVKTFFWTSDFRHGATVASKIARRTPGHTHSTLI